MLFILPMPGSKYKSVLLVDDSYIDNLINRKIIENNNFAESITVIDSPYEALGYLQQCLLTRSNLPDVIFLDIRMPGMNGFEFLKELNLMEGLLETNLKIYILSSSLDPHDLKMVQGNEMVSKFISKPLTNKALEDILE